MNHTADHFVHRQAAVALLLLTLGVPACSYGRDEAVSDASQDATTSYFPGPGDAWESRAPEEMGFDATRLQEAVDYAVEHESDFGPDLESAMAERLAGDSLGEILGPMKARGPANGLILRGGYIVAEWGDTDRVDMTFSVTKSVLSTTAGLALDRGLIRDLQDPIRAYVPPETGLFESEHNAPITWHMLLQQRSEWEGTLWDKPDVADRRLGRDRALQEPGSLWEYNDVRVNLAALALLYVWRRPLPEVLSELVMDPIGASDTWQYHGYRNSYVTLDGESIQSVSGGGHWGGGLWISSRDQARFGYLHLRGGRWNGRQLLSEEWVEAATTPAEIKPTYGYMWWLNTGGGQYPSAPESSFFALGGGSNIVWMDPDHDLVAVVRWIDGPAVDGFMERVVAALVSP